MATLPELEADCQAFLDQVGHTALDDLEEAAERFDAKAALGEDTPKTRLLRIRVAAAVAHMRPMERRDSTEQALGVLRAAKGLRDSSAVPAGCAEGFVAEAYLALCKQAKSTAKRALFFHQGRAAARRALRADPDNVSAHLALGSFFLHVPPSFGRSLDRAVAHLGRAVEIEPLHRGARMLLAEAQFLQGDASAYAATMKELRDCPPLRQFIERRLGLSARLKDKERPHGG